MESVSAEGIIVRRDHEKSVDQMKPGLLQAPLARLIAVQNRVAIPFEGGVVFMGKIDSHDRRITRRAAARDACQRGRISN